MRTFLLWLCGVALGADAIIIYLTLAEGHPVTPLLVAGSVAVAFSSLSLATLRA